LRQPPQEPVECRKIQGFRPLPDALSTAVSSGTIPLIPALCEATTKYPLHSPAELELRHLATLPTYIAAKSLLMLDLPVALVCEMGANGWSLCTNKPLEINASGVSNGSSMLATRFFNAPFHQCCPQARQYTTGNTLVRTRHWRSRNFVSRVSNTSDLRLSFGARFCCQS